MKSLRTTTCILTTVLVLTFSFAAAAQTGSSSDEVLTNDKVIAMIKAGLPPAIIVNKIRTSKTNFNTSTEELIRLQNARVPAEIMNAMVDASHAASNSNSRTGAGDVSRADPNDPASAHEAGIYLLLERDGQRKMIQLEPTVSKQSKTGGVFKSVMTYGIAKMSYKASLSGERASLQIDQARPVFYFYFEVKGSGLSTSSSYATSPNEFAMVKLDQKSNTREVIVMQANAFGAQSGTMDKASRAFHYEKIAPGVYKVTPQVDLADGEYGFYNAAGIGPSGGAKIFDFSIKQPR